MAAVPINIPVLTFQNSPDEIAKRLEAGKIPRLAPWLVLPMRTVLFVFTQALTAIGLLLAGSQNPGKESIYWWPVYLIIPNLITLAVLVLLTGREGLTFSSLWKYARSKGPFMSGQEILAAIAVLFLGGLGFVGTPFLLYSGKMPEYVGPLPMWAAWLSMLVTPISIALVELPNYMGYSLPRLEAITQKRWLPVLLAAFWLALQHSALPLIFDARFILYRFLSMMPLALCIGLVYQRFRRLGPLMVIHYLLDLQLGITVFMMSLPKV